MTIEEPDEAINFSILVRADQALEWLTPILGSRTIAKAELADLMRDGALCVFARRTWNSKTISATAAWNKGPDEEDDFTALYLDIEVGPSVWRRSRQWQRDQIDWRWPSGRFSVVHRMNPYRRMLIDRVHFDRSEIKRLGESRNVKKNGALPPVPIAADKESVPRTPDHTMYEGPSKATRRGRHVRGQAWAIVCVELLRLQEEGKLLESASNGRQNLAHDLAELTRNRNNELAPGTIEPLIAELIKMGFIAK